MPIARDCNRVPRLSVATPPDVGRASVTAARGAWSFDEMYPMGYSPLMRIQMTEVYRDWIDSLKDRTGRARVQVRVDRLAHGNPGNFRALTDGVIELKIDVGPGYRVYYTERAGVLIILLAGGDKSSQTKDIQRAIALARSL